jgi:hypothetical protein
MKSPPKKSPGALNRGNYSPSAAMIARNSASANAAFNAGCDEVVLSAMMNGHEMPVTVEDFSPRHRPIFNAIVSLPRKGRNFRSVTDTLRESGELESVGDASRITEVGLAPHDAEIVADQLERVLDCSRQRRMAELGDRMRNLGITPSEALEQLSRLCEANRRRSRSFRARLLRVVRTASAFCPGDKARAARKRKSSWSRLSLRLRRSTHAMQSGYSNARPVTNLAARRVRPRNRPGRDFSTLRPRFAKIMDTINVSQKQISVARNAANSG